VGGGHCRVWCGRARTVRGGAGPSARASLAHSPETRAQWPSRCRCSSGAWPARSSKGAREGAGREGSDRGLCAPPALSVTRPPLPWLPAGRPAQAASPWRGWVSRACSHASRIGCCAGSAGSADSSRSLHSPSWAGWAGRSGHATHRAPTDRRRAAALWWSVRPRPTRPWSSAWLPTLVRRCWGAGRRSRSAARCQSPRHVPLAVPCRLRQVDLHAPHDQHLRRCAQAPGW
jgi:hypothetical protein